MLIGAEREGTSISTLLSGLGAIHFETQFIISSVTVMELEHGWDRADTVEQARKRRRYIDEVFSIVPVEAFTAEMGVLAAKLDAGLKKTGVAVATADLLIGVTALYFSYGVGTRNARHLGRIPGLQVISL